MAAVRGDTVWRKIGSKPPLSCITLFMNADVSAVLCHPPPHPQLTHFLLLFQLNRKLNTKEWKKKKGWSVFRSLPILSLARVGKNGESGSKSTPEGNVESAVEDHPMLSSRGEVRENKNFTGIFFSFHLRWWMSSVRGWEESGKLKEKVLNRVHEQE